MIVLALTYLAIFVALLIVVGVAYSCGLVRGYRKGTEDTLDAWQTSLETAYGAEVVDLILTEARASRAGNR